MPTEPALNNRDDCPPQEILTQVSSVKNAPFKKNENLLHKQFPTEILKIEEFCLFVLPKATEDRPPES